MKTQGKRFICILLAVILTLQMMFVSGITVFADTETPIVTPSDVDIYGVSLVLSGEIGLTFHVNVKRAYRGGTMELKFENKEYIAPITVNITDCPTDGNGCYMATYYLSAIELSEPVMLTVYDADGTTVLAKKSCSAEDYVNLLLIDEEATEAEKNIGKTLINYGHFAQLACSEANGWEIGEDYAETTAFYAPTADGSVFDKYEMRWSSCSPDFDYVDMALFFDYNTAISLCIPVSVEPEVLVNGVKVDAVQYDDCSYEIQIAGISALHLEDEYEVTINGITITLSAFSFGTLAVRYNDSPNTVNAVKALYEFYMATVEYNTQKAENNK